MKSGHTLAYFPEQGGRSRLKLPRALASNPPPSPVYAPAPLASVHVLTRVKSAMPRRVNTWREQRQLGPSTASEWGEGSHCWCCRGKWIWSSLDLRLAFQDHTSMHPGPHWVPTLAPLPLALFLSGVKVPLPGDRSVHTWNKTSSDQNIRASDPAPWNPTPAQRGW